MRALCSLALVLFPGALIAGTPGEEDAMTIHRLSATDFEVVAGSFTATNEYFWCGAASFIERRNGLSNQTMIYLKRPVGPSAKTKGRKSVVFSTSARGLPSHSTGLTLSVSKPGVAMKSFKGRQLCRDAFTRSTK